ncbi:MAG: 2-oxo acid dehydrogenase subunit E2, partial [Chloroflexi bacterium]|nr:2-oxo acid dehydrogenase subunit E2 [Chloroflexota bacterium]
EAVPVSTEAPVAPAAAPPPSPPQVPVPAPAEGRVPLSRMRQQIARVTVKSKQEKPHFYVSSEIDMTRAMELRVQINEALETQGIRVSVNDLIIKACVEALKAYPKFNAFFDEDGMQMNDGIHIGIAIAQEEGLIVPAIMDCEDKSLAEIAVASKDLVERSNSGTLHPREYTGGTFAISNLGMFEVTSFLAIIQPPQTAVLAVGTVAKRPVVRNDQVVVAQTMMATLSADHRIVDGAEGAQFLVEVKRLLENPVGFFL